MKRCFRCQQVHPLDQFFRNRAKPDGLAVYCRECQAGFNRAWYDRNKIRHRAATRQRRKTEIARRRRWIQEYLQQRPCVDCGEADTVVLEFDHVRGVKTENISTMVATGHSWSRVLKEIELCEIRCANCHRRKTVRDRECRGTMLKCAGFAKYKGLYPPRCDNGRGCEACRAKYQSIARAKAQRKARITK
jgi:hypothetical protein